MPVSSNKRKHKVSRHGNRRLNVSFPNDPYPLNNSALWPNGIGELTPQGQIQMYNLGKKIRSMYNGFLDIKYSRSEFRASSTTMERVVMSGEIFTEGLYPPTQDQWIPWLPVPIYSDSLDNTQILEQNCSLYLYEIVKLLARDLDEIHPDMELINSYVSQFAGTDLKGLEGLIAAFDTFISEDSEGYPLPDWVKHIYPSPINELASKMYIEGFAGSDKMVQLVIGPFLNEILETIKRKGNGTLIDGRKMRYYSGHDATLITLQAALGIPRDSIIGLVLPGSAMVYEMHRNPNQSLSIKVLYVDGGTSTMGVRDPFILQIPGCGQYCDFERFLNATKNYSVLIDYDKECKKIK